MRVGMERREKDGKIAREIGRDAISILRNLWAKFCSHVVPLITRETRQAGSEITIARRPLVEIGRRGKDAVNAFQCTCEQDRLLTKFGYEWILYRDLRNK